MNESPDNGFFLRNAPFIDTKIQSALAQIRVGIVGCGLASQAALTLARVGIRRFRLWDYDDVDYSNLNRQAFYARHVGVNKARATASMLLELDRDIQVDFVETRLSHNSGQRDLADLDIVVNSADFDDPVYYEVGERMRQTERWCVYPMNLGFGGFSMVLGHKSPSLESLTGGRQTSATGFILGLANSCSGFAFSPELLESGPELLSTGDNLGWYPQNAIASSITSALLAWSVVKIVRGEGESIAAPRVLHFEPFVPMG